VTVEAAGRVPAAVVAYIVGCYIEPIIVVLAGYEEVVAGIVPIIVVVLIGQAHSAVEWD